MKILFVSLFLPQQKAYHAGGRYVYEILKKLSARHEIYLATRCEESESPYIDSLKPFCKKIYPYKYSTTVRRGILATARLVLNYIGFSLYADKIVRKGQFDIIQVEWVETALMIRKRDTPMILDAHDVITKPAERLMNVSKGIWQVFYYLRYLLIKGLELSIMKKFNTIFTLSEYDRVYLQSMVPDINITTVPPPAGLDITDMTYEKEKSSILFLASYKYRKVNVDAALYFYRSVFPLIRERIPDAKFIIAGYGPPTVLTALQANDPNVLVPGFVEDTDEYYKKATVFVAPIMIGGGIIIKILDAMSAGTPVVTTSYGNEGIGAEPGKDLLIADDPESMASAVISILTDGALSDRLAGNSLEFVQKHYSPEATIEKIESAYKEILAYK